MRSVEITLPRSSRRAVLTAHMLALVVSVMAVGALVIGPALEAMRSGGGGRETVLILAAAYDVLALSVATGLSVYKPGGRRRAARRRPAAARA